MQTSSPIKTIGFRLLSFVSIAIGMMLGNSLVELFLKYPMKYFPYPDDPKQFYWLALIPTITLILSVISIFYLSIREDLNFYNSTQFTIKRLIGSLIIGIMIVFSVRSLVFALSWFLHASGN